MARRNEIKVKARAAAEGLSLGALLGYGAAKLVPGMITFASVPVWVHQYGAAEYGRYGLVWAISLLATSLFAGWIRQSILRGAGNVLWTVRTIPTSIHLFACVSSVMPVAGYALLAAPPGHALGFVMAASVFGFVSTVYAIAQAHIQRTERSTVYAIADSVRATLTLGLTLILPMGGHGAISILNASSVGYVFGIAVSLLPAGRTGFASLADRNAHRKHALAMWKFGWPMSIWLLVTTCLMYIDRFFVTAYYDKATAGHYIAIADLINRGIPMLAFPVTMAIHPIAMRQWNNRLYELARRTVSNATRYLVLLLLIAISVLVLFAPIIFKLLLPSVPISRPLVGFLALGSAMWQLALLGHKPFEFARRTGSMLVYATIAVTGTLVIDAFFVPTGGPVAAAIGFAFGAAIYCVTCFVHGRRVVIAAVQREQRESSSPGIVEDAQSRSNR